MSAEIPDKRVVVAMSGGVDSSVAAYLTLREGTDAVGLFMRNGVEVPEEAAAKKSCCSVGDARDARMVAAALGIPFQAVDLKAEFADIIRYFIDEYRQGRTPNPCAVCNRDLKFDRLLRFADELGAEAVVTGHYARLAVEDGRVRLRRGVDRSKDQSYQLFCVAEENLLRTRLPLGELEKSRVREIAEEAGLRTARKADSQEICFVPGNDYRRLLREKGVEFHAGDLVDTAGRKLGTHEGTENFTIGQRRGHGIGGGQPLYVVDLIPETGTVVLGSKDECCYEEARVRELNFIGFDPTPGVAFEAEVQVRYHHRAAPAEVCWDGETATIRFVEPQLAVAPGQGAALYRDDLLIGGGWIEGVAAVGEGSRGEERLVPRP